MPIADRSVGLPHVTDILKAVGLIDTRFMTDEDRALGSAVHLASQYFDEGTLDFDSLTGKVALRLTQYRRFLSEMRPTILKIEEAVENKKYGYCGTYDRLLVINSRRGILDIKGTSEMIFHGPQLSAYAGCFAEPLVRWDLYLSDDSYKLVERKEVGDWPVFCAALNIHNYRKKHDKRYVFPPTD